MNYKEADLPVILVETINLTHDNWNWKLENTGLDAKCSRDGGSYGDDHFDNGTPYGLFHELWILNYELWIMN